MLTIVIFCFIELSWAPFLNEEQILSETRISPYPSLWKLLGLPFKIYAYPYTKGISSLHCLISIFNAVNLYESSLMWSDTTQANAPLWEIFLSLSDRLFLKQKSLQPLYIKWVMQLNYNSMVWIQTPVLCLNEREKIGF